MSAKDHKIRNQQTRRLNNSPEGVIAKHVGGHIHAQEIGPSLSLGRQ
jgi:hypothetical protein